MGTTKTSGWAMFWFLLGFTLLFVPTIGPAYVGFVGAAFLALSAYMFKAVRPQEEK